MDAKRERTTNATALPIRADMELIFFKPEGSPPLLRERWEAALKTVVGERTWSQAVTSTQGEGVEQHEYRDDLNLLVLTFRWEEELNNSLLVREWLRMVDPMSALEENPIYDEEDLAQWRKRLAGFLATPFTMSWDPLVTVEASRRGVELAAMLCTRLDLYWLLVHESELMPLFVTAPPKPPRPDEMMVGWVRARELTIRDSLLAGWQGGPNEAFPEKPHDLGEAPSFPDKLTDVYFPGIAGRSGAEPYSDIEKLLQVLAGLEGETGEIKLPRDNRARPTYRMEAARLGPAQRWERKRLMLNRQGDPERALLCPLTFRADPENKLAIAVASLDLDRPFILPRAHVVEMTLNGGADSVKRVDGERFWEAIARTGEPGLYNGQEVIVVREPPTRETIERLVSLPEASPAFREKTELERIEPG